MNRNIYDTDCVTWSPQGRIFQIEYADEATKQGTCCVGVTNGIYAAIVALRRSVSKLAAHNSKTYEIDDHVGAAFSGITADASIIVDQMRADCISFKFRYSTPCPVQRLLETLALTSQKHTLHHGKRPYGVSLMIAGYDSQGAHIFETHPSGDYDEYVAHSFGSRCQSARTYLEKNEEAIKSAVSEEELLKLALSALAVTVTADNGLLEAKTINAAVVGKDVPFKLLNDEQVGALLTKYEIKASATNPAASATMAD